MGRSITLVLVLALLLSLGCKRTDDGDNVPAGLQVVVHRQRGEPQTITSELLRSKTPDFAEGDHRGWKLSTLLPKSYQRGLSAVEIEDRGGQRHRIEPPDPGAREVIVLTVNRAGRLRVASVRPALPFPPFHGRGGNRGRRGDPSRVKDVQQIWLKRVGKVAASASAEASPSQLVVTIEGQADTRQIGVDALLKVPSRSYQPEDGRGVRKAWSLRDVLAIVISADAELVAVEGPRRLAVSRADWRDEQRIPLLRMNREGAFRFRWVDENMQPLAGGRVRRVKGLRVRLAPRKPPGGSGAR